MTDPDAELFDPELSMHRSYRRVLIALAAVKTVAEGNGCLTDPGADYLGIRRTSLRATRRGMRKRRLGRA